MSKNRGEPAAGRPLFVTVVAVLTALCALAGSVWLIARISADAVPEGTSVAAMRIGPAWTVVAALCVAGLGLATAWGLWQLKNWARTALILIVVVGLVAFLVSVLFGVAASIFAGEQVVAAGEMLKILGQALVRVVLVCVVPSGVIYGLIHYGWHFEESVGERNLVDRLVRYLLVSTALSSILIVFLIILFTMTEAWESIQAVGAGTMLLGTIWRPGSIIGNDTAQLGMLPMVVGSILSTAGAVILGVPLSIGTAVLLAEIAPPMVREVVRPAIELLAGIPSVIYGLFGMVVIAPMIQRAWPQIPYNTGYSLLNASFILAVMIIPTVTNIAEDAIRAVPRLYREGSLALGATHFQTIVQVILPSARSGLIAAVILGIGRALGETMAVIMVIGNSIAFPSPLIEGNPLTLLLSSARTLTGNIAVEIAYAEGVHRSALFFTGVLLFAMIFFVNSLARYLMRERGSSKQDK